MFTEDFLDELAAKIAAIVISKLGRVIKPSVAPRYLTVKQAAEYISHTKASFEYLMSKNLFPVIRHDRLVLIDREDLDKFMLRHKT